MGLIIPNGGASNLGTQGGIASGGNPLMSGMQTVDFGQVMASIAAQVFEQMTISKVKMKYKKLTETAKTPTYATEHDTCADLYADEDVTIPPYSVGKISTGLAFEAPEGFYFRILPRSGMSSKGYIVTAGVIDNQYRGAIIVALYNSTSEPYEVHQGDRIAQVEMRNFHQMDMEEVKELTETDRNTKGFGSSGK